MHRAIDISVGSLSPTINWGTLKNEQFLLPSKDQQVRLAELLWVSDEVVEKNVSVNLKTKYVYNSVRESLFFNSFGTSQNTFHERLKSQVSKNLKFTSIGQILNDIRYGTSVKNNNIGKGIPVIGIPNIIKGKIHIDDVSFVEVQPNEASNCILSKGDILIVRTNGNPEYTGKSALFDLENEYAFASYLIKVTIDNSEYDPEWVVRYLQSDVVRKYFRRNATSTAGNYNINTATIKSLPIPITPIEEQNRVVEKLKLIEAAIADSNIVISHVKQLQKFLINQIF
jgi:type I restriction enzyme S subunit